MSGPGSDDLRKAAAGLAARLPGALEVLTRIAYDYRWSWAPGGPELWRSVDAHRWERCGQNPVRLLQEAPTEALTSGAVGTDPAGADRAGAVDSADARRTRPDRRRRPHTGVAHDRPRR